MKKSGIFVLIIAVILIFSASFISAFWLGDLWHKITGFASEGQGSAPVSIGPSEQEQACMKNCFISAGCELTENNCTAANKEKCSSQCGAKEPEETPEQKCVSSCVKEGCSSYDFACQSKNMEKCDKQCRMVKEPEPKNEEEKCIRECVNAESPGLICQPGEGGEKGNEICQKCAAKCVHLYEGPCLGDEKLREKEKSCETCQHCYGAPIMGDSGEGYECITDVECKDATSEWGDEPGEGAGIVEKTLDVFDDAWISVKNFVSDIFSSEKTEEPKEEASSQE